MTDQAESLTSSTGRGVISFPRGYRVLDLDLVHQGDYAQRLQKEMLGQLLDVVAGGLSLKHNASVAPKDLQLPYTSSE